MAENREVRSWVFVRRTPHDQLKKLKMLCAVGLNYFIYFLKDILRSD